MRVYPIKSSPQVSSSCNSGVNSGVNTFIIVVRLTHYVDQWNIITNQILKLVIYEGLVLLHVKSKQ